MVDTARLAMVTARRSVVAQDASSRPLRITQARTGMTGRRARIAARRSSPSAGG